MFLFKSKQQETAKSSSLSPAPLDAQQTIKESQETLRTSLTSIPKSSLKNRIPVSDIAFNANKRDILKTKLVIFFNQFKPQAYKNTHKVEFAAIKAEIESEAKIITAPLGAAATVFCGMYKAPVERRASGGFRVVRSALLAPVDEWIFRSAGTVDKVEESPSEQVHREMWIDEELCGSVHESECSFMSDFPPQSFWV